MSKKFQNKKKNVYKNNDLGEPLQDIELKIIDNNNNTIVEEIKENKQGEYQINKGKMSICSKLFFSWTFIVMQLSNNNKLTKDIIRNSPLFTSKNEQNQFQQDFNFLKELWYGNNGKGGFNKWKYFPLIFTVFRFNLRGLIFLHINNFLCNFPLK